MASIQLSLDSPDIIYIFLSFESNKEYNSSSFNLSSHQDSSKGQEIELVHSYLVFDPAQMKARACYSWWLAAPMRSWWSGWPSELVVVIVEARRRSWWPCSWFELHHAGDGERRLLVSVLVLVTWEVTRPFVGVTTWIRGDCQIIDTTGKKSTCLLYFQAFTLCHLLCLVSLACLCYLFRLTCLFFI
jgi:hypothetical protein